MEWLISIFLGVGLAAAVGFRIFLPFLLISIAGRWEVMQLGEGFEWIATTPALILFSTATVLEILSYYIPWFDNLLDTITTPLAMLCGSLVMASAIVEMEPWVKWTLAVIAGGGTAGLIKGTGAVTRLASTGTTGGLANPVIASAETGGSLFMALVALFVPVLAIALVALLIYFIFKRLLGRGKAVTTNP
jgi:hypothetical protein